MLDGTWKPTDATMGGQPFPPPVLGMMTLTISGGGTAYRVQVGPQLDVGTTKVDDTQSPRAMDISGVEGPNAGKTIPAIYDLDGDTLRVCYDLSCQSRPNAFASAAGTQHFLVTYQRAGN